jgi:hypothetical protein
VDQVTECRTVLMNTRCVEVQGCRKTLQTCRMCRRPLVPLCTWRRNQRCHRFVQQESACVQRQPVQPWCVMGREGRQGKIHCTREWTFSQNWKEVQLLPSLTEGSAPPRKQQLTHACTMQFPTACFPTKQDWKAPHRTERHDELPASNSCRVDWERNSKVEVGRLGCEAV